MQNMLKRTYSVKKERSQKNTYTGVIDATECSRLSELVIEILQDIDVNFKIFDGYAELPEIKGSYKASVSLECQRCMSSYSTIIEHDFHFYIGTEDHLDDGSSVYEVVNSEDGDLLDIILMIEDDIILNLPLIPRHEKDCNDYLLEMNLKADKEGIKIKKNPFAVLEGLKTSLKH